MSDEAEVLTISVPKAGQRYFGVSRNTSYAYADAGIIPTIQVGRLRRVPIAAMDQILAEARQQAASKLSPAKKKKPRSARAAGA